MKSTSVKRQKLSYYFIALRSLLFDCINVVQIFDWEPEFYNNKTDIPADMPQELQEKIAHRTKHEVNYYKIIADET